MIDFDKLTFTAKSENMGFNKASLEEAVIICRDVEEALQDLPCHVALTGGTLYKNGPRKDIDILFYRVRQEEHPEQQLILDSLEEIGFEFRGGYNWVTKARYRGFDIDLFFPELYPEISENREDY